MESKEVGCFYLSMLKYYLAIVCFTVVVPTTVSLSQKNLSRWQIQFWNVKKKMVTLSCEVAQSSKELARGLMFQKSLGKNSGMIFIYQKPRIMRFWMRNTQIPLSIAFVNENNVIIGIHSMKPYDERIISSHTKAIYAIEANQGWFRKNYIFARSKIKIIRR